MIVTYSGDFDHGTVLWSEGGQSLNNLAPKFARAKLDLFSDCLRQQAGLVFYWYLSKKQLWHKYLNLPKLTVADLLRSLWQFIHPQRKFTLPLNSIGWLSALIENSHTINKTSWPTHISYGFKKVSILIKIFNNWQELIMYTFWRLAHYWLHILSRHGVVQVWW